MKLKLTARIWVSHCNMLLSAALYYSHKHRQPITIQCVHHANFPKGCLVLEVNGKRAFLDYKDSYELEPMGLQMDMYGKRSLTHDDAAKGIFPLGFHFNYSFGLHRLLWKKGFLHKQNKIEIIRSVDLFRLTNMSHFDMQVPHLFARPTDNGGRVIFYTRLWDPARNPDPKVKELRCRLNEVRIKAVRTLRKMDNTSSGIFPDAYAQRICPDLLVPVRETTKRKYMANLHSADIGIDGLIGSPGWKIGEYVACSKGVISNAIESVIPGFTADINYLLFDDPATIPDLVMQLRRKKNYRYMQEANWCYCLEYLHPDVYFQRILEHLLH